MYWLNDVSENHESTGTRNRFAPNPRKMRFVGRHTIIRDGGQTKDIKGRTEEIQISTLNSFPFLFSPYHPSCEVSHVISFSKTN
jgi:hypothetical protein